MRNLGSAQYVFAIASASVALLSLAYGDFAPGGTSLPAWIPWRTTVVYGVALLVLAASGGLCCSATALRSVLTIGWYFAAWALIGVPMVLSKPLSVDGWYGFIEALSSLVGAWILYAGLRWRSRGSEIPIAHQRAPRAAQMVFGLTCVFYGWSHFVYADFTAGMVPGWLPGRLEVAYFTGFCHVAAGIALIIRLLPGLAATLEAIMMSLFGLLVWVPSFFVWPRPGWATPPENQWSELVVTLLVTVSAWIVAASTRASTR